MCSLPRLFVCVLALSCTSLKAIEKSELPKELRLMIEKLDAAKTIEVSVKSSVAEMATWTTRATSADKNRLKITMSIQQQNQPKSMQAEFISDGKSLLTSNGEMGRVTAAHPQMKDRFQQSLSRTGFLYTYLTPVSEDAKDEDSLSNLFKITKCSIVKQKNLKSKKFTVITYDFLVHGTSQTVSCRVWIDPQTHLPVKRTFNMFTKEVTETYSDWRIDQAINPKTFILAGEN